MNFQIQFQKFPNLQNTKKFALIIEHGHSHAYHNLDFDCQNLIHKCLLPCKHLSRIGVMLLEG